MAVAQGHDHIAAVLNARLRRRVEWLGGWWCRKAHSGFIGPRFGARVQCAECGREWKTPWAVSLQAQPDTGYLTLVHTKPEPGTNHPRPVWGKFNGVAAFVIAGMAVGVLVAAGLLGGVVGWLYGRGFRGLRWMGQTEREGGR